MANNNPSTYITQIKQGSIITGNMKSEHSIRVDGSVTGDLVSSEKIIVGGHGRIGGNLKGTDITIEGTVEGDVLADGMLHLSSVAKIQGRIFSKGIEIEKGAEVNGVVAVGKEVVLPDLEPKSPLRKEEKKASSKPHLEGADETDHDNYGNVAW